MPRPKRTKVAPSAPAPRVRKPTKAASPVAVAPVIPKESFNDLYDVSDAEQEVTTTVRHVKKNNGNGKGKAAAASSSRGLGPSLNSRDSEGREGETLENRLEMDRIPSGDQMEESLLPDIVLDSSSPAVEVGRKERNTPTVDNSLVAIGNFRRRPRQPSILGRGPGRARSSSVESNLAEDGLMSVGRKNTSAMLMSNFKRRPRERSIMGRNAAPIPPSSMALEMERGTTAQSGSVMKISAFKRREREPSILRTAQKPRLEQQLDYDDEDEDDFNPEDESTPLNLSKTRNMTSSSTASSSNPRKRKLSAVQPPRSSPSLPSPGALEAEETVPATYPPGEKGRDEAELSPEPLIPSIEARSDTPEPLSETMAPPQSSSPIPSSPELPAIAARAPSRGRRHLRGRTPPPRTQDSPISSPPSLTHSPNRPSHAVATKRKPQRAVPPPSTFSTVQLQSLLPRRRTRHTARDPFDIPSSEDEVDISGLAPDDDELSHLNVHARARRHTSARTRTPAPLKKVSKVNKPALKERASTVKRTYGSRANVTSDKENDAEIDPDDSLAPIPDDEVNDSPENSQELENRVGKELKRAAKKFQEVDEWELEFEEITASSSSPKDAR